MTSTAGIRPDFHGPGSAAAGEMSISMRAIVQERYGERDVLRMEEIDRPEIAADEVLVRVHAAGLDPGTWHAMTGRPYLMRIMGFGFRGLKNRVPGLDAAGTVVEIGSAVTRFAVGDEVFGIVVARVERDPSRHEAPGREPRSV